MFTRSDLISLSILLSASLLVGASPQAWARPAEKPTGAATGRPASGATAPTTPDRPVVQNAPVQPGVPLSSGAADTNPSAPNNLNAPLRGPMSAGTSTSVGTNASVGANASGGSESQSSNGVPLRGPLVPGGTAGSGVANSAGNAATGSATTGNATTGDATTGNANPANSWTSGSSAISGSAGSGSAGSGLRGSSARGNNSPTNFDVSSTGDGSPGDPTVPGAPQVFGGDEQIVIHKPKLEALVSVNDRLSPFALDSDRTQAITLNDVLKSTVAKNLDIAIAGLDTRIGKSNFWGSVGQFLPDIKMGYQYQYLKGKAGFPLGNTGVGPLNFDTPFIIASAGFTYHVYRGGSILYGALRKSNLYKAARYQQRTTISDSLLNTTRLYYDLVLNEALLQIRIRAVEVSKAQLQLSQNLVQSGRGTNLDLFQSETQLSSDTQNLIDQQVARRVSAIKLADFLNSDQGIDLVPIDEVIATKRLMPNSMTVPHLVALAIDNRPELKNRKEEALAAKKQQVIASAPLQPKLDFTGTSYGIGTSLGKHTTTNLVYNPNGNGQILVEHGQRQIANLYSIGLNAQWGFGALGTTDIANINSARLETRKAYLQLDRERNQVIDQARTAYLNSLSAARKLEEANKQVRSATEELRLSRLRFENGLSKNIDVLRAQQDYTNALIVKAQAIINYNIAQAQLVHDVGLTSVDTLTRSLPEGT